MVGGNIVDPRNADPFAEDAPDDNLWGCPAYYTVDLAPNGSVQHFVLLNAASKTLERDLAHETQPGVSRQTEAHDAGGV